jgi:predicted nucleic acid-binding Zn ribbon protein
MLGMEVNEECLFCGEPLTGKQKKYCSTKCGNDYRTQTGHINNWYRMKRESLGLKCILCGKPVPPQKEKYCSTECLQICNRLSQKLKRLKKRKPKWCKVCGKQLKGKRRMFCSDNCLRIDRVKRGYYKARHRAKVLKMSKVCHVCGKVLPPQKQKYCSYTCARIRKNLWDSTPFERDRIMPQNPELECDECGGRIILMPDNEYVCNKCGLVY